MKPIRWMGVAVLIWAAAVPGGLPASAAPLSPAAAQALREPPEQMSPALQRELESLWADRATPFLRALLDQPGDEVVTQLWIDRLADQPYLHFKAVGQNAGFASDPRRNIAVVLFVGPSRQDLDREFGDWFAPYEGDGQFIRPVEFGAERSAMSNITDDGTFSLYWQQANAFVEVRTRGDVVDLAQRVHAEALRTGIYSFPRAWEPPAPAETETVALEPAGEAAPAGEGGVPPPQDGNPPGTADAAAPPTSPAETASTPVPVAPAQPSQEELASGWERISGPTVAVEASEAPAPPPAGGAPTAAPPQATPAATAPRIPASTLGLAIHAAVRRDEASPVAALIRAGADLEAHDSEGRTPLMTAAESASPAIIRQLIEAGADVEAVPDGMGVAAHDQGMTPLMLAARAGRVPAVVALVEAGASLAARNAQGHTAQQIAAAAGHEEVVRVLRSAAGEQAAPPPAPIDDSPLPVVREDEGDPGTTAGAIEALDASGASTFVASIGEVRQWQARLEAAWKRQNVDLNEDADATVLRALILDWDARVRPDSPGATAYEAWRAALAGLDADNPARAPEPSAELADDLVVEALKAAAASLRETYGDVEVPYSRKKN